MGRAPASRIAKKTASADTALRAISSRKASAESNGPSARYSHRSSFSRPLVISNRASACAVASSGARLAYRPSSPTRDG